MKKELSEGELLNLVKKVASKTISADIEPVKYEDISNKLFGVLSKCLKENVDVSGNGLDGNDMVVTIEKDKNN